MSGVFWRGVGTGVAIAGVMAVGLRELLDQTQESVPVPESKSRHSEILSLGRPTTTGVERTLRNHVLHYSHDKRGPAWVLQHLSRQALQGSADRAELKFRADPSIEESWRALTSDYWASGWSRGHMVPAADCKRDEASMSDTFLYSNIVPQDIDNNANFWNRMEIHCRDLTLKFDNIWVTSGPAYVPEEKDGKKFVSYQVIGKGEVAVPTHLYKVVVAEDLQGTKAVGAFLVPNRHIDPALGLTNFQVPLEDLEKRVGFKFYDRLDRGLCSDLCEVGGCNMITDQQLRQYVYCKRLDRVKRRDKLDNLWQKIQKDDIPVTEKMQTAYDKKLKQLVTAAEAA